MRIIKLIKKKLIYIPFDEWFEGQRNNIVIKDYIQISESFLRKLSIGL